MAARSFGASAFLLRWLFALLLVLATYNPTGLSFVHWMARSVVDHGLGSLIDPIKALVALILLVGWITYLRFSWRALGLFGLIIPMIFFAIFAWFAIDYGILDPNNRTVWEWITLIAVSVVLGIGMSWSHLRRRLSGQVDVDEVEQ